jgi:hypothetical protein
MNFYLVIKVLVRLIQEYLQFSLLWQTGWCAQTAIFFNEPVQHVTGNDQDYLRKIPRVVVQKSALL